MLFSLIYYKRNRPKYHKAILTNHGLIVELSYETRNISKKEIENWTAILCDFWHRKKSWKYSEIRKAFYKAKIKMIDRQHLIVKIEGEKKIINGVAYLGKNKRIEIATLPLEPEKFKDMIKYLYKYKDLCKTRVYKLFRHELSHLIVCQCDEQYYDVDLSHLLFDEVGIW